MNLASRDEVIRGKSFDALAATMEAARGIDADAVVFHVGSHLGYGFDDAVEIVAPALRELLELTTDSLWLCLENAAGAGGTIGRSVAELEVLFDAVGGHRRLGVCLDSCHWWASGVDITDAATLDEALADLDARIGLERLRLLHVNDAKTPLGSNRDRHEVVAEGVLGAGSPRSSATRRSARLPAVLETWPDGGLRPDDIALLRKLYTRREKAVGPYEGVADAGEDPEARAGARELVELGVPAAEIVLACGVRLDDVDLAHRERCAPGADGAEPAPFGLGRLEQREIDLDVEDLLEAADVRAAPGLVGVHERAAHAKAGGGVDDLLAMDGAVAAFDLVLNAEREPDVCLRLARVAHLLRLCASRASRRKS